MDNRKKRQKLRNKVIRAMQNITDALAKIKTPESPEREYALIFKDEKTEKLYFRMVKALHWAYDESFRSERKLIISIEELTEVQHACLWAGWKTPPTLKQLSERHTRTRIIKKLREQKMPGGLNALEWVKWHILEKKDENYGYIKERLEKKGPQR
jgi:hypothetical protein